MTSDDSVVDLRSDTVTRPTPAMRRAMAEAEVGDDVYGEDPTVRRLEEEAARRLAFEAALFVPSGTMGNQIAIHLHAPRGSDVLVEATSHVFLYELGAMAAWTGATARPLAGRDGRLAPEQIDAAVAPAVYYLAPTSLLVLENSHNHAGGVVTEPEAHDRLVERARAHALAVHLDGARLFNAAAALGVAPERLARGCDSVMFCLSKGLGAPVGSLLCGPSGWIARARVIRKRLGGGMRQAGILAAAGLYALEHHVGRLADDHARARRLAEALAELPVFEIDPQTVRTNIVIVGVRPPERAAALIEALARAGIRVGPMGAGRIRFVTHLDVDDPALDRTVSALRRLAVP